jgi:EmrB/QacA subfamily drug resistance transporter
MEAVRPPLIDLDRRAKTEIMLAILLALFLGALDQTIVGVALPTIATRLGGAELYAWSITIYLLTSTITGPFYGKLSDLFGRKPILIFGVSIFLVGSALSGLSQNMQMLILFRGIQGVGAGALFPVALAVIGDLYSPAERGKYQGLFGAVFGVSSIVGPLLGGFLTEQVGWQSIFYVNVPIGIVSLFVLWRLLPNVRRPDASRNLDYLGAAVFTFAISFLLLGLSNKSSGQWADPVVGGFIALGVVGSLIFLLVESRAKEPIVPLGLFRNRTYALSIAATFFAAFGFFAAIIWLPLWFQFVEGASPTNSGLYALPLLGGLILSAIGSGQLVARTQRYKVVLVGGIAVMIVGLWLMSHIRPDTPLPLVWSWMFVTGLGVGPTFAVFTIAVQNAVPIRDLGVATGNLTFFRQIGGSIALAVTGTVLADTIRERIPSELQAAGVPQQVVDGFTASGQSVNFSAQVGTDLGATILAGLPAAARPFVEPYIHQIVAGIHGAFSLGVAQAFIVGMAVSIVAFVAVIGMPEIPLRNWAPAQAPSGSEGSTAASPRAAVATD